MSYVIAYDIGTTGVKACIFSIESQLTLINSSYESYNLYVQDSGEAEQDADEWWQAICKSTKALMQNVDIAPEQIDAISFCSQMQGLVLVDEKCNALRRPMSYMDQRATKTMDANSGAGIKISGISAGKLAKCLSNTMAAPTSVKDPLWKYLWVKENEPEIFEKTHKWLDVKEYLIARATGKCIMTWDSAYATFLYKTKGDNWCWCDTLCDSFGVNKNHLADVVPCCAEIGNLSERAATELGLTTSTKVFGGGGDATLIGIGAGCTQPTQTHIYSGTSGWVSTICAEQHVDLSSMIAAIVGAESGIYNYFAEMETAGKCFEWVKDHLALDEINVYLNKQTILESEEAEYLSLYDYLSNTIKQVPPGCNGLIFTPWLHGNRCPFEDPNAAGMFFNIKLNTGKTEMIRAVLEGICFHLNWMLECQKKKIKVSDTIRFAGGGALSSETCQMLADITGHTIETVEHSQDVGACGAAIIAAVGLGLFPSVQSAGQIIPAKKQYKPNPNNAAIYQKNYKVYKQLYKNNKKLFEILND
ncbi:MAG: FGGY-family carbohydrate kinase [Coriobacteriales bacterium]|nr:FGGY-family carbohydrate kinase [Coriobacteriales bacterium]